MVVFLLPWEIDAYARSMDTLGRCLQDSDAVSVDLYACLGISSHVVNWDESTVRPQEVVDAFHQTNRSIEWARELHTFVSAANEFRGCVEWRRDHLDRCDAGRTVIWLDPDVVFPVVALSTIAGSLAKLTGRYFIATPQVPRMWDESWDGLVHERFKRETLGHCYRLDSNRVNEFSDSADNIRLIRNTGFKFGGGWFTVFAGDLLKLVGLPTSFGPYGQEDTFIMKVCEQLQRRGWPIAQYIMQGLLIAHDFDGSHRARERFRIINDKDLEAAHNRSIRDKEVARTVRRVECLGDG